jgi:hypothetical protein
MEHKKFTMERAAVETGKTNDGAAQVPQSGCGMPPEAEGKNRGNCASHKR